MASARKQPEPEVQIVQAALLLDVYGALLTERQRQFMLMHFEQDLSFSEIAREFRISRQAVHKTVSELARRGILEVIDDPQRGNSKLVHYTDKGRLLNRAGAQIIQRIESDIAQQLGEARLRDLKQLLAEPWDR